MEVLTKNPPELEVPNVKYGEESFREDDTEFLKDFKQVVMDYRTRMSKKSSGYSNILDESVPKYALEEDIQIHKDLIQNIRLKEWNISRKLRTVRLARSYISSFEGSLIGKKALYKEYGLKFWQKRKRDFRNLVPLFIPWDMRIKKIESHFGSVVSSYFIFIRWLLWINVILAGMTLAFILLPLVLAGGGVSLSDEVPRNEIANAPDLNTVWNFEGYLKYSLMFYGHYTASHQAESGYKQPLAYFLTCISTLILSFVVILYRMAQNSRLNRENGNEEQVTFSWKLFTAWDYTIGESETSKNKSAEICTNFKESILEVQERSKVHNPRTLIILRIFANILVILVLASSTYAIYVVVDRSTKVDEMVRRGESVSWIDQNLVALVTSSVTAIFPSLFELIGMLERYHPRQSLRWQLARILVLYLLNLYTLLISFYWKIRDRTDQINNRDSTTTFNCDILNTTYTLTKRTNNCSMKSGGRQQEADVICWETEIGQELMKLMLFDLVITILQVILIDFVRGLVVRYFNPHCCWNLEMKFPEYGEFKIAENILHLINNQAMIWLGTFFAPAMPTLNVLKLISITYIRSWAVLMCNIPLERVFRATRSNNFYQSLLLLMLFLVTVLVTFLLVQLPPSPDCGPFSAYTKCYHVLEDAFPKWLNSVINYIASPGVVVPLFALFLLGIFYLTLLTKSLRETNKELKQLVINERKDRKKKTQKQEVVLI